MSQATFDTKLLSTPNYLKTDLLPHQLTCRTNLLPTPTYFSHVALHSCSQATLEATLQLCAGGVGEACLAVGYHTPVGLERTLRTSRKPEQRAFRSFMGDILENRAIPYFYFQSWNRTRRSS